MKVIPIDSKSITPIEYSHLHDSKISFTKYRENFDFGLTVNQYYFNQNPKDKKTNFNTQYTLTDLFPLSTIAELNIPFTNAAVGSFSTTIQQDSKYLKTDFTTNTDSISSTFVDASEFSTLSSEFLFTFTLTSVPSTLDPNKLPNEDRISISQEYNSITYYLSAPNDQNTTALWTTTEASYFSYALEDNKLAVFNPKGTTSTPGPSANVLINTATSFLDVNNGTFTSTDSAQYATASENWTVDTGASGGLGGGADGPSGWTWADGAAKHIDITGNTSSADNLYQDVNTILGNNYEVTLTVSLSTAGTLTIFIGTSDGTSIPKSFSNGTHTVTVDADNNAPNRLFIQASPDFVGTVDDISVVMIPQESLHWKAPAASWQQEVSTLSASFFDVNRNLLTKDFKYIPNSYSKYLSSFNPDAVDLNTSTTVQHISNNYFVYNNNYNFFQKSKDNAIIAHADIIPLKNQATVGEYYAENNHFNAQPAYLNRVYEKINAGTNQINGYDHVGLSYNIGTYDLEFKPNKLTYFTTPNSMAPYTVLNIKDSKIHNLGAVPGNNPLMSDKVFKRREVIKNNTFSDSPNPVYLCSWLSGSTDGSTRWVDRYYNPLVSDFSSALSGTAYYNVVTAAGAQTTETFDVSSSLTFEPNNDYIFYHVGSKDYEKLLEAYTTYNTASSVQYTNYKGIPATIKKAKADDNINLNGETLGKFNTNITGDFSINFWLNTADYTLPFCYQLLGNYFEDGFGIFNTDLVTPNIILPAENTKTTNVNGRHPKSKLLFFNNDFEIYDEIILMDGVDEIEILGVARRDNFSNFYVLGSNNVIYVFDTNNNLISKIEDLKDTAPENSVVEDFEVGECTIHVLFNPVSARNYFTYNTDTNKSSTVTSSPSARTNGVRGKISDRNNNISILSADNSNGFGNEVAFDSSNTPFITKQFFPNQVFANRNYIQKGFRADKKDRIESGLDKQARVHGLVIDDEDQLVVLHDSNVISILDNNRKFIRAREFCKMHNLDTLTTYLDLIYDFEDGVYKKYILLVQQFINGVRLTKLDFDLNIIFSKKLRGIKINDLQLTKTITSYGYLQKTGANKNKIKAVIKTKPKFSSTGSFARKKTEVSFDTSQLNPGWNHFFVNVSTRKGSMSMFVNGKLFQEVGFQAGKYALDQIVSTGCYIGAVSTPYYLTLANKLLQPKKYFVNNAAIKGFKLYNKTMDYFDIMAHYNYHLEDKSVVWSYPLGQRTYIDTIDKLMKFNYPEKLSNKYQLEVKNMGIKDPLLTKKIKDRVEKELEKITPYYDEVKDIIIS